MKKSKLLAIVAAFLTSLSTFTPTMRSETITLRHISSLNINSRNITMDRLPQALDQVSAKLPLQINDAMFWMECFQREDKNDVCIVIQVNTPALDCSTSEYTEMIKQLPEERIAEVLSDEMVDFISLMPTNVMVMLAFTDFTDFNIYFWK